MTAELLALLDSDPVAGVLAVADLREQRTNGATPGGWFERGGYVCCNSGDPADGVNICAARVENAEHIAAEANPAQALAAVRRWRGVVDRHFHKQCEMRSLCVRAHCATCIEDWPCPDLTETADEAKAYLGSAT